VPEPRIDRVLIALDREESSVQVAMCEDAHNE
jgi:hypothetical protein